ncbi:glycosyltransferase [Leptolyngbya iicbica]|nr:glycosyltransferase [Leptolyngbya sp. LK]
MAIGSNKSSKDDTSSLNVLVVSSKYPPEYSGSGLRAHNTYKRLRSKFNINFEVLSSSISENTCCKYEWQGIKVTRIANKRTPVSLLGLTEQGKIHKKVIAAWKRIIILTNYCLEAIPTLRYLYAHHNSIDVIHVFGNVNVTSVAITYAKLTKKPLLIELVNFHEHPRYLEPFGISLCLGRGFPSHAIIVAISRQLEQAALNSGYSPRQIWCRPNPIDESKFNFSACQSEKEFFGFGSKCSDPKHILHLAKFMPRKNQLFMVDVLAKLPHNFRLILAGPLVSSGPLSERDMAYFQSIQESINSLGLRDRVLLQPEFIDKPENFIRNADVFVLPSVQEGLGTPVLEALACGIPVVTNRIPGVFDQWINDGENGYMCTLEPDIWAEKIYLATQIPQDAMKLASKRVLQYASTQAIDQEYFSILCKSIKLTRDD